MGPHFKSRGHRRSFLNEEEPSQGEFKMPRFRFTELVVMVLFAQFNHANCLWFADTSLFQPPNIFQELTTQSVPSIDQTVAKQQQNQTQWALNRWLSSLQGANQLPSGKQLPATVSNSTGASANTMSRSAGSTGHWTRYPLADIGGNSTGRPRNGWPRRHSRQQQQPGPAAVKLVQGERGSPGPKGEMGPRGERGEQGRSGLIVVRDLLELFAANGEQGGSQAKTADAAAKLVFVESEQMLVVRTSSGWRPVALLRAPLRDPREKRRPEVLVDNRRGSGVGDEDEDDDDEEQLDNEDDDDLGGVDDDWEDNDDGEDAEEDDELDDEDEENAIIGNGGGGGGNERKSKRQRRPPALHGTTTAASKLIDLATTTVRTPPMKVSGRSAIAALPLETRPGTSTSINHPSAPSRQLKLRLAALNEPFSGNVHGLRGADFECKRHAAKARLRGSFRAMLATSYQNLNELVRLNTHKYPIVNLRGETLASSWNDLFKSAHGLNPLSRIYSFDRRHVATDSQWPNKLVWHGASNRLGYRDVVNNCDAWHSDSLNKFGTATPLHNPSQQHRNQAGAQSKRLRHKKATSPLRQQNNSSLFEHIEKYPCRMPLVVLCIETVAQPSDVVVDGSKSATGDNSSPAGEMSNSL